ncbi:substrate-binding periplasmic protein [Thalassotalea euphylliae]|uniref:substrate-binding periplasmic protein n=1 Tax=Thalassotalea euphylliae TaxID=1655234 RepID=UPI0015F290E4|nr:transporter substrate-binding domain-containing protein [Thalassotalea euphylliae]
MKVVTEQLPPLQIHHQGEAPTGAMVEIVELLLQQATLDGQIVFYPWARAYEVAQQQANTLIFSIMRTPAREHKFHWVAPLLADTVHLIRLKSRPELAISAIEQAKQFRIGVTRSDIAQFYLEEKGFTTEQNILLSSSYPRLWQSLFDRKVDYIMANEFMWRQKQTFEGETFQPIEVALSLDDFAQDYYLAASLNTSPIIISKLKKALEKIHQSGQYLAILQKWHLAD